MVATAKTKLQKLYEILTLSNEKDSGIGFAEFTDRYLGSHSTQDAFMRAYLKSEYPEVYDSLSKEKLLKFFDFEKFFESQKIVYYILEEFDENDNPIATHDIYLRKKK